VNQFRFHAFFFWTNKFAMTYETIFFDFDGVIVESVRTKGDAFHEMYLPYGKEFADRVLAHHLKNGGVSRFRKFRIWNGEWLGEEIDEERVKRLASDYSDLVRRRVIEAPFVHGALGFLQRQAVRCRMWVVSGTPTGELRDIIEGRGLNEFFQEAYGSPREKSYWVEQVLECEGLKRSECAFIGDTLTDFSAATKCGLKFVLRETPEAKDDFHDFTGARIPDLSGLGAALGLES
jgi:phosphoglycolate phosphatase-like HAD superfamily hydrolase